MKKPILCLDFDGVLHSYTSGWKGVDVIPDPPVPGALDFVKSAIEHFEVHIYSSRSADQEGRKAMVNWLCEHNFPVHTICFPHHKPAAFLTIDDRAMMFTGEFPDAKSLLNFKPWNK